MNECNVGAFQPRQKIGGSFAAALVEFLNSFEFSSLKSALFVLMLALTACSGGGGGGGGESGGNSGVNGGSVPQDFVVSGTVSAPGGAIAFLAPRSLFQQFADALISPVHAAISGMATVPDGTAVQLVRINSNGMVTSVIATTVTTSGGSYSFNLTALGLSTASDLAVQVTSLSSGAKMRAFAVSSMVDIGPVSETAVRVVLEKIGGTAELSLGNFTPTELADITGAINLLVISQQLAGAIDIETTVVSFKNAVNADANILNFVDSASASGQTSAGPGDIGNYFPLSIGNTWQMKGSISTNNGTLTNYATMMVVSGTKIINGIQTLIITDTNPQNAGIVSEDYYVKTQSGITYHGNNDATDFLSPQMIPYHEYLFPLRVGASFTPLDKSSIDLGEDWDWDGINENVDISVHVTVSAIEGVTVPAGTYPNCVKITSILTYTVKLSEDGSKITEIGTLTEWFAPGVGPVKRALISEIFDAGLSETMMEELESFSPPLNFSSISVSGGFSCGVTTQGVVYCWGGNLNGTLGDGTRIDRSVPTKIATNEIFTSVSANSDHACGVTINGKIYCWGNGTGGQFGDGVKIVRLTPVPALGDLIFTSVSTGVYHTCALTIDSKAYCWGENSIYGRLGDGTVTVDSTTPVPVSGGHDFVSLSAGMDHTCGITAVGILYCWGGNNYGQLGDGTRVFSAVPIAVARGLIFTSVSSASFYTCGVTITGAVYCWGMPGFGQFPAWFESNTPILVSGNLSFFSISSGSGHICGIATNKMAYCWGKNNYNSLGYDAALGAIISVPTPVLGGISFKSVSTKGHSCGIAENGAGYCWGSSVAGGLGNWSSVNSIAPTAVFAPQ